MTHSTMSIQEIDIKLPSPSDPEMAQQMEVKVLQPNNYAVIFGPNCQYGTRADATIREYLDLLYEKYVSTMQYMRHLN
jgi:hypothetical protein